MFRGQMPTSLRNAVVGSAVFLPVCFLSIEAAAQELEEVIVTVRRVAEDILDTPVAVTNFDAQTVEYVRPQDVGDILDYTPGAQALGNRADNQSLYIRGVQSDFSGSAGDAAVVVMNDNAVISRSWMRPGALFDLANVQVARGPQGTSFGRNATAGVVHFLSNRPQMESETVLGVGIGDYSEIETNLVVNRQLSDSSAGRLSVFYRQRDGYFSDEITGDSYGDRDSVAVRGQLLVNFSDRTEALFRLNFSDEHNDNPSLAESQDPSRPANVLGGRVYQALDADIRRIQVQTQRPEFWDREMHDIGVDVSHSINDDVALNWNSSFRHGRLDSAGNAWGINFISFMPTFYEEADVFQTEVRLDNSASGDRLRWTTGLYYLDEDVEHYEGKEIELGTFFQTYHDFLHLNTTKSIGLFGQIDYDVSDTTTLSIGGRYTKDDKDTFFPHVSCGGTVPNPPPGIDPYPGPSGFFCYRAFFIDGAPQVFSGGNSESWDDFSGRLSVVHQISETTNLYASYATAFKSGLFTNEPSSPIPEAFRPVDPETVETLELGLKGRSLDGTLQYDVAVYVSEYDDRQVESTDPIIGVNTVVNQEAAEMSGIEASLNWLAADRLQLMLTAGYLDHEDTITGEPLTQVMDWTAVLGAFYTVPLSNGATLRFSGDARMRSDRLTADQPPLTLPGDTLLGGRITWLSSSGNLEASLYGRNLTDEDDIQSKSASQILVDQGSQTAGDPRTIGLNVRFLF